MPYFLVDGESIYDRLRQPKIHLLVCSNAEGDSQTLKSELDGELAELVDLNAIPLDAQVAEILGTDKSFTVLLRPDNYIGAISQGLSTDGLRVYLNAFVGQT
jgi:hypothetical protein